MTDLRRLSIRRRLVWLRWLRWLLLPLLIVLMLIWKAAFALAYGVAVGAVLWMALRACETSLRRQFVREAKFPQFLLAKLVAAYPQLRQCDADLVLRGLRQFFMAHLRSNRKFVSMPSRIVDAAWHDFILHTKAYQNWCDAAFGGLLHHSPAEVLGRTALRNDGLRRTWYWACKDESIDPRRPARLPLLFALDRKFGVDGGFFYVPDCKDIGRQSGSGSYCGSSFGESSGGDGDFSGFGGSEGSPGGDSGDSGDSGCGGGD